MKILFFIFTLIGYACSLNGQTTRPQRFDKDHTIDYLVVYDTSNPNNFIESRGGREAYAQEIVDSINSVLRNSKLDYRFRLAGVHFLENYKAPDIVAGHDELSNNAEVLAKRRETKADIVVLLTETMGDVNSGLADHNDNAIHADAYSCVNLRMAASSYTAAHEAGHILGGYHGRGPEEHTPSTHEYAAGYYANGYRTVLCSMVPGTTVPVYSGPDTYWNNVRMGDEKHDNLRIIKHNLPRAVHFGEHLDPDIYYASKNELLFDKNAQEGKVSVYGNQFMSISTETEWIKQLTPLWGNIQADLTFQLEPNYTGKERTGSIIVTGDANYTRKILITQTAADANVDSDAGSYGQQQDSFVDQIQFIRTFDDTEWQTLYIPFIWRYNDWKDLFDIAQIKSVQRTTEGAIELTTNLITEKDLQPHTPYLIRAKKAQRYNLNIAHVIFTGIGSSQPVDYVFDSQKVTLKGTYQEVAGQDMYNQLYYCMNQGKLTPVDTEEHKLSAFRWYLSITENGQPVQVPVNLFIEGGSAQEETCQLTVTAGKGGSVQMKDEIVSDDTRTIVCNKNEVVTLQIVPEDGFETASVVINEQEKIKELENNAYTMAITENTWIQVLFEKDTHTTLLTKDSEVEMTVNRHEGTILLEGLSPAEIVGVYTINGQLITRLKAEQSELRINLPRNEVYILCVADKSYKIQL